MNNFIDYHNVVNNLHKIFIKIILNYKSSKYNMDYLSINKKKCYNIMLFGNLLNTQCFK